MIASRTPRPARFLALWAAGLLAILAGIAAFDAVVDPYDLFDMPRIAGLSRFKPRAEDHTEMVKAYQALRLHPRTVLLGTSRVDIGLDPDSPIWPAQARPVYDYGVPLASVRMIGLHLRHIAAVSRPNTVLIGLEFENFLGPDRADSADVRRLLRGRAVHAPVGRWKQKLSDAFLSTMTLAAFRDSLATVAAQHTGDRGNLAEDGSTSDAALRQLGREDGAYELFRAKDSVLSQQDLRLASAVPEGGYNHDAMADLRDMLAFCQRRHIRVVLAIMPYHADVLELLHRVGVWPDFERWKRDLAALAAGETDPADPDRVRLWDFSGYDRYATEPVPAPGDRRTAMRWWLEPSHFSKPLGEMMLRRVFGSGSPDFGIELTPADVGQRIAAVRLERTAFLASHPGQVSRLDAFLSAARPDTSPSEPELVARQAGPGRVDRPELGAPPDGRAAVPASATRSPLP